MEVSQYVRWLGMYSV